MEFAEVLNLVVSERCTGFRHAKQDAYGFARMPTGRAAQRIPMQPGPREGERSWWGSLAPAPRDQMAGKASVPNVFFVVS